MPPAWGPAGPGGVKAAQAAATELRATRLRLRHEQRVEAAGQERAEADAGGGEAARVGLGGLPDPGVGLVGRGWVERAVVSLVVVL